MTKRHPIAAYIKTGEVFERFKVSAKNIDPGFMEQPRDMAWIKEFRVKLGLSLVDIGVLTGYSKTSISQFEKEAVSDRYLACIQTLWDARELYSLPTDFQVKNHLIPGEEEYIPLSKIAWTSPTGEWRRCPQCGEIKYFWSKRNTYCSKWCGHLAQQRGMIEKRANVQKRPIAVRCPECGHEDTEYRKHYVRDATDKSFAEATHDEIRRLETTPSCDEIQTVLRRLKEFLRIEKPKKVPESRDANGYTPFFNESLRRSYEASQEKARSG